MSQHEHDNALDGIAHSMISIGMENFIQKEPGHPQLKGVQDVMHSTADVKDTDVAAMITMAVTFAPDVDGAPGYAIHGGICGQREVLQGLMVVISQQIAGLVTQDEGKGEVKH